MNTMEQSYIAIENRTKMEIKGVSDVLSYDGERIIFDMGECELVILGKDFNIRKIDVENKTAEICGYLYSLSYNDGKQKSTKSFFTSLFK